MKKLLVTIYVLLMVLSVKSVAFASGGVCPKPYSPYSPCTPHEPVPTDLVVTPELILGGLILLMALLIIFNVVAVKMKLKNK